MDAGDLGVRARFVFYFLLVFEGRVDSGKFVHMH